MRRALMVVLGIGVLACRESEPAAGNGGDGGFGGAGAWAGTGGGSGGSAACANQPSVVSFITDDGVKLEADDYPTGEGLGPSVVLLHMIPPANDRSNYPKAFIDALGKKKIRVLNVDRRGAGASEGVAQDAYLGANGKLDAKAAVQHLLSGQCGVDPLRIGIVGASNGTTTALDYAVYAAENPDQPLPSALVLLTGGPYTENQNVLGAHHDQLDPMPIQFVFSPAEGAWSQGYQKGAPATWRFEALDPGDHGTKMFDANAESIERVAGFLAEVL
ncbi:MAG: alpha/beta hydrolase [Polyangiaceae bacterium]|nr:alpha/beta hydrolase [Polyangiaceae bacterium]